MTICPKVNVVPSCNICFMIKMKMFTACGQNSKNKRINFFSKNVRLSSKLNDRNLLQLLKLSYICIISTFMYLKEVLLTTFCCLYYIINAGLDM